MGGKKGPEKNRKYEKDRRDRFNEQFVELHKLLPDFSSSSAKATKAEIISKTIQYLKESHTQTRKLEIEFENEKVKVTELQKKVNGVLQIVKELIKLLHKSNIRFPSSLPVDDFKTFQDVFTKSKKELTLVSTEKNDSNDADLEYPESSSDSESEENHTASDIPTSTAPQIDENSKQPDQNSIQTNPTTAVSTVSNSCLSTTAPINSTAAVPTSEPNVLKLNSDAIILPSGNLFSVNGTQNNILNCYNSTPPVLLNKPFVVPTLILMQNNFVPVNTVQHIAVSQRTQKLILPKQTINTTKTTFINKKPIPSVRLYRATSIANGPRKATIPRRRRSRRSKGILVKYPKRKPPTKTKKRELRSKRTSKSAKVCENTDKTFTQSEPSFSETSTSKPYPCASMLNIAEIPSTGQLIDFFENTANPSECGQSNEKGEKSHSFVTNTFEHSFATTSLTCAIIHKENDPKAMEEQTASDAYVPAAKNFTPSTENGALEKLKTSDKEIATSKDLNLTFDDKKQYESTFDEFSNDLFTSLQVPPSGHNADSISPTAAFLQTFPLVSSGTNVDLLPDEGVTTTTSTTILQIGNLESPTMFSSKPREALYSDENSRKEKKNACKDGFADLASYQLKSSCSKDANMSFYPSSTTSFSSYFTKYNDFPVTSLCSQPFTKTTDSVSDFSSWMPSYTPDESNKKRDKTFKTIQDIESYSNDAERKSKKPKLNARPLVNWMTTPDLRSDVCQSTDTYLSKEDTTLNSYVGCNSSQNTNFNSYSDYYLENQNYSESQLASCKLSYSNPCTQSWVPAKSTRDASNVIIPSTLPTLVGDLALGTSFNNYDLTSKKFEEKKKCRNYCKNVAVPNSTSFLSVTQLVDDKSMEKKKNAVDGPMCFGGEQEKCAYVHRSNDEYVSKKYQNACKEKQPMKCKKDSVKYQAPRCASKENKKDARPYPMQSCQVQNKEINPLSSKNSNYSAESLISSSNQVCSGYFPYENSTNYGSCSNDYSKRRTDEESLANVGYYGNSNYVYHNNFQSFNNYGLSNQCYNNYSSQIQTSGFQKKKDEGYAAKDTNEWSLSYNAIQSDFSASQKVDPKCKQFANKYNQTEKNSVNSEMYSKYYQGSTPSTQTKSNCAYSCSFNQTEGQSCVETNYLAPNYEIKSSRHNGMNNTVQSATTLTNFNLSTIFPEMNDKHCSTSQVNAVNNEKNDPKYSKNNVDETNFNYFLQPAVENNTDHYFGSSSSFQIHNFTDFSSRKTLK